MEHDLKIRWNFFATSHGKGVVDGIGGTLKRTVWRHVKAERARDESQILGNNSSQISTLNTSLRHRPAYIFLRQEMGEHQGGTWDSPSSLCSS